MAKAHESLSVAVLKKIDAICDRFEADWRTNKKPAIEKYLGATTGPERAELLRLLLKLELELQSGKKSSQATYEKRFPDDTAIIQSVFRDLSERTTSQRLANSADTSVNEDSVSSQETAAHVPEETPRRIGRFEIVEVLGQGAFGRVYKARDPHLDRHVAIKVPLKGTLESKEDVDRFLREAKAAATLQHPNLCPVHEVGQEDRTYFIVMAFLEGKTLSASLKERKEPVAAKQAALIIRKLALALSAAHAKGIVHRDLKPANVMIERERKDVVIMDFGLARRRKNGDATHTREGVVMGTPAYMSPEQARGDIKAVSPASDIYSLGIILYEMLAGKVPFSGSVTEVIGKVLHVEPDPPSTHRAGVDPTLEAICMMAIAKEPGERFASMKEVADAIDGFLKGVPSESIIAKPKPKAKSADSSAGLTQVVQKMSAERKQERKALEKTVSKHSRNLRFVVVAAIGFLGLLIVASGIIMFFFRNQTTIVQVTLITKIDQRLIDDGTITFFLNDKQLSKEQMERPIELKEGRHVLQARRGNTVVQEVILNVGGTRNNAKIEANTTVEYVPNVEPPKKTPDEWVDIFNGKNFTGWTIFDKDGAVVTPDKGPWSVSDGAMVFSRVEETKEPFTVTSDKEYANFRLRFQFQIDDKIKAGVRLRAMRDTTKKSGSGMVRIGNIGPNLKTGYFQWSTGAKQPVVPDPEPKLRPAPEWNEMELDAQGRREQVFLNGQKVLDFDREELSKKQLALPGLTRPQGYIGLLATTGTMRLRKIAVKEYKTTAPTDGYVNLFNGKDLTGWKPHPDAPGNWRVVNGILVAGADPKLRPGCLFTERDDYTDFHFLVEARINDGGNSGQFFRSKFQPGPNPVGYEAQINSTGPDPVKTGSLHGFASARVTEMLVKPGEWFTQEVIAQGNRIIIKVNGKQTVDYTDSSNRAERGHLGLQLHSPAKSVVEFRSVKVKELKPGGAPRPQVVFLGDTITRDWEGQDAWKKNIEPLNVLNFGIGGSKTQDLLTQLNEGKLDPIKPRVAVLMIGTNNTGSDSAEQIAEDIQRIVKTIREKSSGTKVLLLAIFPRSENPDGPIRAKLDRVNTIIAKLDDGGKTVKFLDVGPKFLQKDGVPAKDLMPDYLHLSPRGYEVWAEAMMPTLREMLGVVSKADPDREIAEWLARNNSLFSVRAGGKAIGGLSKVEQIPPGPILVESLEGSGNPNLTDDILARHAHALRGLRGINGNKMRITGVGFAAFKQSALEYIDFVDGSVNDAGLEAICRLPSVRQVDVPNNKVTNAGLVHLPKLPNLTILNLSSNPISDDGLVPVGQCKKLHIFHFADTPISNKGLAHLAKLDLRSLALGATKVTDDGLRYFKDMTNLEDIAVHNTAVSDAGLVHLKNLKSMQRVLLPRTKVAGPGLVHLRSLPALNLLVLNDAPVDDAAIPNLLALKGLRNLELRNTKISEAGFKRLREGLPKCDIMR